MTKQVTYNLLKTYADSNGLPAFSKITNQTETTQNSVTPTFSFPLSNQVSTAVQATAAGIASQSTHTAQLAGKSFGFSAVDQWVQAYTLSPVTDTDQLRRLRVLYQYVTGWLAEAGNSDMALEAQYPIILTSSNASGISQNSKTTITVTVSGKPVTIVETGGSTSPDIPKTRYVRRAYPDVGSDQKLAPNTYTWQVVTPDVTFITQPGCILCDYGHTLTESEIASIGAMSKANEDIYRSAHKLEKNLALRNDWIYPPGQEDLSNAVALPSNGFTTLYAKKKMEVNHEFAEGMKFFYELVLFSEDAASQGTGSPTSDGQSNGRKSVAPERINIPVGGIVTTP